MKGHAVGLLRSNDRKDDGGDTPPSHDEGSKRSRGARLPSLKGAAHVAAERLGRAGKGIAGLGEKAREARYGAAVEGNMRRDDGTYRAPDPMLDERELEEIDALKRRYDRLREPGAISRAGKELSKLIPKGIGQLGASALKGLTSQKLYEGGIQVIMTGFKKVENQARSFTMGPDAVIRSINNGPQDAKVSSLEEITLLRGYDIAQVVRRERREHLGAALIEGVATGVPGLAGIPFNLVLSTFLYYRAVQSIAMLYGYDVRSDPSELMLAGQVFTQAMSPESEDAGQGEELFIAKVMAVMQTETVKKAINQGWSAMAREKGLALLIVQMRALANQAAQKALTDAGQKGLEKTVFEQIFSQVGKRLSQDVIKKGVPVIGGVIGGAFDTYMMSRVLELADTFYHKRFLLEKQARVEALVQGVDITELQPGDFIIEQADGPDGAE